jgi:hypothetical protein
MAVVNKPTGSHVTNGEAEIQRLEAECGKLREALAKAESERDAYRHLFLKEARERREFEDLDLPALQAMSAGPIEKL